MSEWQPRGKPRRDLERNPDELNRERIADEPRGMAIPGRYRFQSEQPSGQRFGRDGPWRGAGPRNYQRSDERIREDLSERLMFRQDIDSTEVSVEVHSGVVTLEGSVPARWMKHVIEDLAAATRGAKDVENRVRVLYSGGGLPASAAVPAPVSSSERSPPSEPQAGGEPAADATLRAPSVRHH